MEEISLWAFFDVLLSPQGGLIGLGISSFLSATILPGSSEVLFLLLIGQNQIDLVALVSVASLANTLGGMSTFCLGRWSEQALVKRGKYKEPSSLALARVRRWGIPVLLLSWVPLIGDALCLAAGWLRLPWLPSLVAMLVGKTARYCVLMYGLQILSN